MARASSRSCDGEQHGKDQANRAPGRGAGEGERLKHAERCEPELEREVGCKDEVDRFERGRKRQVLQTAPATRQSHRCRMRQSPRSLDACLAVRSSGTGGDGGAAFGSSMILNQMPAELLETVLSCECFPLVIPTLWCLPLSTNPWQSKLVRCCYVDLTRFVDMQT